MFNNSPLSIPHQVLVRDLVFAEYDHSTRTVNYKESVSSTDVISKMKIRSYYDSYLDFDHVKTYVDIVPSVADPVNPSQLAPQTEQELME